MLQAPSCTSIIDWSADGGKSLLAGDDHIVGAEGTVDDQNIAALVPTTDNPNMSVLRVKDQITDLCLRPGNAGTVAVLCHSATAMADDVLAVRGVVEHPVHKPGAVQAVGPVGPVVLLPAAVTSVSRPQRLSQPKTRLLPPQK